MTVAEAVAVLFQLVREPAPASPALGYQVIIPRRVEPAEIHRVTRPPQKVGSRHFPEVREREMCPCPICIPPGTIRASSKRRRLENADG